MKFVIEQLAICPPDPKRAISLLSALGMTEWAHDLVVATGSVWTPGGREQDGCTNVADLAFNYQARHDALGVREPKPLEFEVLSYRAGENWMENKVGSASHLGMHVTDIELADFHNIFFKWGIDIAQEVETISHTNPVIAGKRSYKYRIYNTRAILGIDLKFIVRRDVAPAATRDLPAPRVEIGGTGSGGIAPKLPGLTAAPFGTLPQDDGFPF